MSFRLKRTEGVTEGIRRIAAERAEHALSSLAEADDDPAEAIHAARKDLKKLRALLRLCREELGGKAFRAENRRYRDAARLLSRSRDAEVRVLAAQALRQRFGAELPTEAYGPWLNALEEERDRLAGPAVRRGPEVERAVASIAAGRRQIDAWPMRESSWRTLGPGLRRTYRDGRRGLAWTLADPSAESVHAWRKRAKDLTYQLRVLAGAWPELLGATAETSHSLTDLLGDHHDLELLAADLATRRLAHEDEIEALLRHRQEELLDEAFALGRRLYAEKPKAFARRLRAYWDAWRRD